MFTVVTILTLLAVWVALALRRFKEGRTADSGIRPEGFSAWFVRRLTQSLTGKGFVALTARFKAAGLWRLPVLEKWLLIVLYGTFLYLAASGFFFAIFIRRGLYGFPLLVHFTAGVIFAVCLALTLVLKARRYVPNPGPLSLPQVPEKVHGGWKIGDVLKGSARTRDIARGLFWVFFLAGFVLAVTALLPMLPWFHYQGQIVLFAWHRWAALVSLLAAVAFADLEFFAQASGS